MNSTMSCSDISFLPPGDPRILEAQKLCLELWVFSVSGVEPDAQPNYTELA